MQKPVFRYLSWIGTAALVGGTLAFCGLLLIGITNHSAWCFAPVTLREDAAITSFAARWFVAGAIFGMFITLKYHHSYRSLGLLPPTLLASVPLLWLASATEWLSPWPLAPLGFTLGIGFASSVRYLTAPIGPVWLRWVIVGPVILWAVLSWRTFLSPLYEVAIGRVNPWFAKNLIPSRSLTLYVETHLGEFLFLGLVLAVLTLLVFRRAFVELVVDFLLRIGYRTRCAGPGVKAFPLEGPVLVIANHAAYLDPLFLGQILPRPTTPMMTANFFDKPIIRQLMVYVFDTIRVPEVPVKREAPELDAAIAALKAGKSVVIFPEGYLRRKDEQAMRRFGRGVWEILRACPETPVVACWIEGSWGSYFSFFNGPPTKNKPRDVRRPIDIGVSVPETVPPEILEKHLATRLHLMKLVFAARTHLGLPDLAGQGMDAIGSDDEPPKA